MGFAGFCIVCSLNLDIYLRTILKDQQAEGINPLMHYTKADISEETQINI